MSLGLMACRLSRIHRRAPYYPEQLLPRRSHPCGRLWNLPQCQGISWAASTLSLVNDHSVIEKATHYPRCCYEQISRGLVLDVLQFNPFCGVILESREYIYAENLRGATLPNVGTIPATPT